MDKILCNLTLMSSRGCRRVTETDVATREENPHLIE